jgi:hypothetical protein
MSNPTCRPTVPMKDASSRFPEPLAILTDEERRRVDEVNKLARQPGSTYQLLGEHECLRYAQAVPLFAKGCMNAQYAQSKDAMWCYRKPDPIRPKTSSLQARGTQMAAYADWPEEFPENPAAGRREVALGVNVVLEGGVHGSYGRVRKYLLRSPTRVAYTKEQLLTAMTAAGFVDARDVKPAMMSEVRVNVVASAGFPYQTNILKGGAPLQEMAMFHAAQLRRAVFENYSQSEDEPLRKPPYGPAMSEAFYFKGLREVRARLEATELYANLLLLTGKAKTDHYGKRAYPDQLMRLYFAPSLPVKLILGTTFQPLKATMENICTTSKPPGVVTSGLGMSMAHGGADRLVSRLDAALELHGVADTETGDDTIYCYQTVLGLLRCAFDISSADMCFGGENHERVVGCVTRLAAQYDVGAAFLFQMLMEERTVLMTNRDVVKITGYNGNPSGLSAVSEMNTVHMKIFVDEVTRQLNERKAKTMRSEEKIRGALDEAVAAAAGKYGLVVKTEQCELFRDVRTLRDSLAVRHFTYVGYTLYVEQGVVLPYMDPTRFMRRLPFHTGKWEPKKDMFALQEAIRVGSIIAAVGVAPRVLQASFDAMRHDAIEKLFRHKKYYESLDRLQREEAFAMAETGVHDKDDVDADKLFLLSLDGLARALARNPYDVWGPPAGVVDPRVDMALDILLVHDQVRDPVPSHPRYARKNRGLYVPATENDRLNATKQAALMDGLRTGFLGSAFVNAEIGDPRLPPELETRMAWTERDYTAAFKPYTVGGGVDTSYSTLRTIVGLWKERTMFPRWALQHAAYCKRKSFTLTYECSFSTEVTRGPHGMDYQLSGIDDIFRQWQFGVGYTGARGRRGGEEPVSVFSDMVDIIEGHNSTRTRPIERSRLLAMGGDPNILDSLPLEVGYAYEGGRRGREGRQEYEEQAYLGRLLALLYEYELEDDVVDAMVDYIIENRFFKDPDDSYLEVVEAFLHALFLQDYLLTHEYFRNEATRLLSPADTESLRLALGVAPVPERHRETNSVVRPFGEHPRSGRHADLPGSRYILYPRVRKGVHGGANYGKNPPLSAPYVVRKPIGKTSGSAWTAQEVIQRRAPPRRRHKQQRSHVRGMVSGTDIRDAAESADDEGEE